MKPVFCREFRACGICLADGQMLGSEAALRAHLQHDACKVVPRTAAKKLHYVRQCLIVI